MLGCYGPGRRKLAEIYAAVGLGRDAAGRRRNRNVTRRECRVTIGLGAITRKLRLRFSGNVSVNNRRHLSTQFLICP